MTLVEFRERLPDIGTPKNRANPDKSPIDGLGGGFPAGDGVRSRLQLPAREVEAGTWPSTGRMALGQDVGSKQAQNG